MVPHTGVLWKRELVNDESGIWLRKQLAKDAHTDWLLLKAPSAMQGEREGLKTELFIKKDAEFRDLGGLSTLKAVRKLVQERGWGGSRTR